MLWRENRVWRGRTPIGRVMTDLITMSIIALILAWAIFEVFAEMRQH
jgi:hypothetical protein